MARGHRPVAGLPGDRGVVGARAAATLAVVAILIMVAATAFSGCTDGDTTTTAPTTAAAPTTTTEKTVEGSTVAVQGLAVMESAEGAEGSIIEFATTVDPGTSGRVAVGMLEGEVFGTGSQWRAAGWMSALAATSLLNLDLADFKVSHEVDGRVDGPSAGALMTVATLAAFLGDTVKPEATMTGAINPDYTIGPVGGIPHKLQAAAGIGKTLVLIPLGQRMQMDLNTGQFVDVVEVGRGLGVEVREVGDIYAAYEGLTGKRLPQPRVVDREPVLPTVTEQTVMGQAAGWVDFALGQLDEYDAMPSDYKTDYEENRVSFATDSLSEADDYSAQGLAGAAYSAALDAARQAMLATTYTSVEQTLQEQGELAAAQVLTESGVSDNLSTLTDELLAVQPASVGEAAALIEAWGRWTIASRLASEAEDALQSVVDSGEGAEGNVGSIYTAVYDYVLAIISVDAAHDALALGQVDQQGSLQGGSRLTELAEAYRRAAEANVDTLEVLVLPQLADEWGVSQDEAFDSLTQEDMNFAEAEAAVAHLDYLKQELPEGPSRDYAVLGAALVGYAGSAASLAEHYSYGAEYDENQDIVGYTNEKALANGLDFARQRARTMIALAAKGRGEASLPVLYYQSGGVQREGYPGEKLDALYSYWTASLYGHIMGVLSGHLQPLAPRP